MAQRRTNIEIDRTREFNALPVRKNKIGVSETRTFDALQRKRKPEPKKQFRDKDISLGTVNFSILIVLSALIVCLFVLVAVYYRINIRFLASLTL